MFAISSLYAYAERKKLPKFIKNIEESSLHGKIQRRMMGTEWACRCGFFQASHEKKKKRRRQSTSKIKPILFLYPSTPLLTDRFPFRITPPNCEGGLQAIKRKVCREGGKKSWGTFVRPCTHAQVVLIYVCTQKKYVPSQYYSDQLRSLVGQLAKKYTWISQQKVVQDQKDINRPFLPIVRKAGQPRTLRRFSVFRNAFFFFFVLSSRWLAFSNGHTKTLYLPASGIL